MGSYQYQSETSRIIIEIPAFVEGMNDVTIDQSLGDHDRAEVGANVSYVLFSGFSQMHAAEAQELILHAVETDYYQVKNNLALRFGILHYQIQAALISLHLEAARFAAREDHLQILEKRTSSGVNTSAQVLSAKAELARAAADTAEAHRKLDSLCQEFESFAGVSYPEKAPLDLPLVSSDTSLRVPDAESLEQQADALLKKGEASQGSALPYISTYVGYRYGNPGLNQTQNEWMGYGVAGIQAQWNLFDGFERHANKVRYQSDSRVLRAQAEALRREQGTALKVLDLDVRASYAENQSLSSGLEAAKAARDAYAAALASGTATPEDLRDADLLVVDMESRLALWKIRDAVRNLQRLWKSGQNISYTENKL